MNFDEYLVIQLLQFENQKILKGKLKLQKGLNKWIDCVCYAKGVCFTYENAVEGQHSFMVSSSCSEALSDASQCLQICDSNGHKQIFDCLRPKTLLDWTSHFSVALKFFKSREKLKIVHKEFCWNVTNGKCAVILILTESEYFIARLDSKSASAYPIKVVIKKKISECTLRKKSDVCFILDSLVLECSNGESLENLRTLLRDSKEINAQEEIADLLLSEYCPDEIWNGTSRFIAEMKTIRLKIEKCFELADEAYPIIFNFPILIEFKECNKKTFKIRSSWTPEDIVKLIKKKFGIGQSLSLVLETVAGVPLDKCSPLMYFGLGIAFERWILNVRVECNLVKCVLSPELFQSTGMSSVTIDTKDCADDLLTAICQKIRLSPIQKFKLTSTGEHLFLEQVQASNDIVLKSHSKKMSKERFNYVFRLFILYARWISYEKRIALSELKLRKERRNHIIRLILDYSKKEIQEKQIFNEISITKSSTNGSIESQFNDSKTIIMDGSTNTKIPQAPPLPKLEIESKRIFAFSSMAKDLITMKSNLRPTRTAQRKKSKGFLEELFDSKFRLARENSSVEDLDTFI